MDCTGEIRRVGYTVELPADVWKIVDGHESSFRLSWKMIERETQQLFHRLLLFERAGVIHHAISFGYVNVSLL